MNGGILTHGMVDDARLASRLSDTEARQVRRYLELRAYPVSVREYFKDADALRNAALLFDKAVDVGVYAHSVVEALSLAEKSALAKEFAKLVLADFENHSGELTHNAHSKHVHHRPSPSPAPARVHSPTSPSPVSDNALEQDDSSCVVCMDNAREATMQCGHANICLACGSQVDECPTCRAPKEMLIKLYK